MKKYVAVGIFTSDERGAVGGISDFIMRDSLEEIKSYIEADYHEDEPLKYNERRFEGKEGTTVLRARWTDYEDNVIEWEVKEFEV